MRRLYRKSGQSGSIVLGDRARDAGQWELAAAHYRIALARTLRNSAIWVQYGHALKESGDLEAAEAAYRRGIEDDPMAADPYLNLGHVLKLQNRIDEAKYAYLAAASQDPSLTDAAVELAALGHGVTAGSGSGMSPPHGWTQRKGKRVKLGRISLADRARDLGQWGVAAGLYRRALYSNPRRPDIWFQYGHMLKQLGDLPEAENAYRRALPGNPQAAQVYQHLGDLLTSQGKRDQAEASYLRAFAAGSAFHQVFTGLERLGWPADRIAELRMLATGGNDGLPKEDGPAPQAARCGKKK